MTYGILIVSHVPEIASGLPKLLKQVAADVPITFAGGQFNFPQQIINLTFDWPDFYLRI